MNNVKASNAVIAIADAMSSMASDYEQQISQLQRQNKELLMSATQFHESLSRSEDRLTATENVVEQVTRTLRETLANPTGPHNVQSLESMKLDPAGACKYLLEQLSRAPCLMQSSDGSSGRPSTSRPFSDGTPSG